MSITLTRNIFHDGHLELSRAYTQIETSLEVLDESVAGAPAGELRRQVETSLTKNQKNVKAIHHYVTHILSTTPKTSRDYQNIYGVTTSERDILPLLNQMQEHCQFFDNTVLPNMMRAAGRLSHYSLGVQANYETIIDLISEKNLRDQLRPINEGISLLIHGIIEEATTYQEEALVVEEQILQMLEYSKNDKQSLTIRTKQVIQERASVKDEVDSINRLLDDLQMQKEQASKELNLFLQRLGIQAVTKGGTKLIEKALETEKGKELAEKGMKMAMEKYEQAKEVGQKTLEWAEKEVSKRPYLVKMKEFGEGTIEALEKSNEAIKTLEEGILKKCEEYPTFQLIKTGGSKTYTFIAKNGAHILTGIEVITTVYNGTSAYNAQVKRDRIIKEIEQKTDHLNARERDVGNLLRVQTDLDEISSFLEEALIGIEFMSVSWQNIVIDLSSVLERTHTSLTRNTLLQVKTDLKTAKSIWSSLHERVEKYRDDAFLI